MNMLGDLMNGEKTVDFESEDFWKTAIKKAVAKRMIRRNHTYVQLLEDVCKLDENEVERLLKLNSTFIKEHGQTKREEYLSYFRSHKYEDWECKRVIDLNEIDIFEICEGKGQPYQLDIENMIECNLYEIGERIAKNLALIKMTDLNYSTQDITKILGDAKTEYIFNNSFLISDDALDKMKNHFINLGMNHKRLEILVNLFKFENNLKNASIITGLKLNELKKIIKDHELFKGETTILDSDKLDEEMKLVDFEIIIEAIVINGMHDYQIKDYSKLSGLDYETVGRLYELHSEFRPKLCEFLKECSHRLMDQQFEYDEIEEITGRSIYNSATDEYYYNNYKKHLFEEYSGVNYE